MAEEPDPRPDASAATPHDQDPAAVRVPADPHTATPPPRPDPDGEVSGAEQAAPDGGPAPDWAGSTVEIPLVIAALAAANGTDPLEEARKHAAAGGRALPPHLSRPAAKPPEAPGAAAVTGSSPDGAVDGRIPAAVPPAGAMPHQGAISGEKDVDHPNSATAAGSLSEHGAPPHDRDADMVTGTHRAASGLRRFVRDYAWVIVAVALAVLVALCSLRFTSGITPVWKAGAPVPSTSLVANRTAAPIVAPAIIASTAPLGSASPAPGDAEPGPAATPSRTPVTHAPSPAPVRTTGAPDLPSRTTSVELGPVSDGELKATLRLYCWQEFGAAEARLRSGTGPWECRGPGFHRAVDMDDMCTWRNGPAAQAHATDPGDAYSWRCSA